MKVPSSKFQIPSFLIKNLLLIIFVIIFLIVSKTTHAHTLKVDGTMGVTVHLDPDDAPVVGKVMTIFVNIKDRSGKFDERNPGNCDCLLTIRKNGKESKKLPIVSGNTYNSLQYTFAESGSYELIVTGRPNGKGASFDPFQTEYSYYVSSGENTLLFEQNPLQKYTPFVMVVVGFLILFMFLNPFKKR